jgi:hypothetical protein|tara:strand:+ start:549 stop:980 length:432 start_codon:yes stop_codon:yes gene_type:complete
MTRKLDKEHNEKLRSITMEREISQKEDMNRRARSCTIGSAGGGVMELCLRTEHYGTIWYQFNPVEAVEMMGQLAAAAGVEMAVRPRKDFASWRPWDSPLPASAHWMGTGSYQLSEEDQMNLFEKKTQELEGKRDNNLLPPQEK